jgi:hypothetical protein
MSASISFSLTLNIELPNQIDQDEV